MILFRLRLALVLVSASGVGCGYKDAGAGGSLLSAFHVESPEWYECARNDVPIPCQAEHPDAGLIVHWCDGEVQRFTCTGRCEPNGLRVDEYGDSWQHEIFIQGNSSYTNVRTGESLFIPLRPPRARGWQRTTLRCGSASGTTLSLGAEQIAMREAPYTTYPHGY